MNDIGTTDWGHFTRFYSNTVKGGEALLAVPNHWVTHYTNKGLLVHRENVVLVWRFLRRQEGLKLPIVETDLK